MTNKQRGFTLIELIIAMGILLALLAFGAPYLFDWLRQARYRGAAGDVVGVLREARNTAISRNRECRVEFDVDGRRWRLMLGNLAYGSTSFGLLRDWNDGELSGDIALRRNAGCGSSTDVNLTFNPNGTLALIPGAPTVITDPDYPYAICIDNASNPLAQKYRVLVTSTTTGRLQVDRQ